MLNRVLLSSVVALVLGGCSASSPNLAPSADHPANPGAPGARMQAPSQTVLAISSGELPATEQSMPGMQHMAHGMGDMQHEVPGASTPATTQATAVFTCTMHPEVTSDKPGDCPKCGMKLVAKKGEGR